MNQSTKLYRYIWKIESDSLLVGEWQYGDGESAGGGEKSEQKAWEQLYFELQIQRQRGIDVSSVEIVFNEPAPVTEESR